MPHQVISYRVPGGPRDANVRSMIDALAAQLAEVKGLPYGGTCDEGTAIPSNAYVVPSDTLTCEQADGLGIRSSNDFFGGAVRYRFMRTKIICHHLASTKAHRPAGWPTKFTELVRPLVLPGYAAFSLSDAIAGGTHLLSLGSVRLKDPLAAGGIGQIVVSNSHELAAQLSKIPAETMFEYGVALELNLREATTINVGRIAVEGHLMSYWGLQRMTSNNEGLPEYGGAALNCVMGCWDALDQLPMRPEIRRAVAKAVAFDRVTALWPDFMASRRNYDVVVGMDDTGRWRSGVLESSWRVGGASTAEIAALKRFLADPGVQVVRASAVREFGQAACPPNAVVHFRGEDAAVGPVLRYTMVTGVVHKTSAAPAGDRIVL